MGVQRPPHRLQVELQEDSLNVFDEIAGQLRRAEGNRKIGVSTVISRMAEKLAADPDLIQKILADDPPTTHNGNGHQHRDKDDTPSELLVARQSRAKSRAA